MVTNIQDLIYSPETETKDDDTKNRSNTLGNPLFKIKIQLMT